MKKLFYFIMPFLLILIPGITMAESESMPSLTLMIYMCGSDLESKYSCAGNDIEEIVNSDVDTDNVNVLLMTGGSERWSTGQNAENVEISHLRGGRIIKSQKILEVEKSVPSKSMGDSETLKLFLEYAADNYPAQKYALILWDHGGGPMEGVCFDENYDPDRLSIEEIADALEAGIFAEQGLEWIGFDACLMGAVEVALQMAPYAHYMIGSEETEPAEGWNYSFLDDIALDTDGAATGKRIIDTYFSIEEEGPLTLSCIDLTRLEPLRQQIDAVFSAFSEKVDAKTYSEIARQRKSIRGYGLDVGRSMRDYDLIDIGHLAESISSDEKEDKGNVRKLKEAINDAVVYHLSNLNDSHGMTVYFPFYNKDTYEQTWKDEYPDKSAGDGYTRFIDRFGDILTGDLLADWSNIPLGTYTASQRLEPSEVVTYDNLLSRVLADDVDENSIITTQEQDSIDDGMLVKVSLNPSQREAFGSARLLVLERLHAMLSSESRYRVVYTSESMNMDDEGSIRALYHEQTLHVVDKDGNSLASDISYNTLDTGEIAVHMRAGRDYDQASDDDLQMIMTFSLGEDDQLERTGLYIYDKLTDIYERRAAYDMEEYPYVVFPGRYMTMSETGDGEAFDSVEWHDSENYQRENVIRYADDWHVQFKKTSDRHSLVVCMEITDTQNNRHLTSLRSINSGNMSKDMLSGISNIRILAENMQVSEGKVSVNFTFLANEDEDLDLYIYDPAVNGKRCMFWNSDISSGYDFVHIPAGSAFTHTVTLKTEGQDALREVSVRFAFSYDVGLRTEDRDIENGIEIDTMYNEAPSGTEWVRSDRAKLRTDREIPFAGDPVLISESEFSILSATMSPDDVHFAAVEQVTPFAVEYNAEKFCRTEDWFGRLDENGSIVIEEYLGDAEKVEIPAEIAGHPVGIIERDVFNGGNIRELTLPDTVTYVHPECFREVKVGRYTPDKDTMVVHSSLKDLSYYAYTPDDNTESQDESVLNSDDMAAAVEQDESVPDAENLSVAVERWGFRHIVFNDTELLWEPPFIFKLTDSGEWEVVGCNGEYDEATIPAEVNGHKIAGIGAGAFQRSSFFFIHTLEISEGIETIGEEAFAKSGIISVSLPSTLKKIDADAFYDCGMLLNVEINCDPDVLPDGLFDNCPLLQADSSGIVFASDIDEHSREAILSRLGIKGESQDLVPEIAESEFCGYWETEREYVVNGMDVFNALLFNIAIYENGTYNGVYLNPIAGQWKIHGNAALTEYFSMFREGDDLIVYANCRRMVCHCGKDTSGNNTQPWWNVHIT